MSVFINKQRLLTTSDNLSGGVNLFRNTDKLDKFWGPFVDNNGSVENSANYASDVNHELIATKNIFHIWGSKASDAGIKNTQRIYFEPGIYTISFLARNNGTDRPSFKLSLYSDYTEPRGGVSLGSTSANLTNVWQRYSITFEIDEAGTYGNWRLLNWSDGQLPRGSLFFANLKLEHGSVATDWCPNYADYYDDLNNQIIGMHGLFHSEKVDKIVKAQTISYSIAAPTVEGYTFIFWLNSATTGWVGSTYIDIPTNSSSNIWVAYPNGSDLDANANGYNTVTAFAVYIKNSVA